MTKVQDSLKVLQYTLYKNRLGYEYIHFLLSAGSDYQTLNETVFFRPGEARQSYVSGISIIDDDALEMNETYTISLLPDTGFESLVVMQSSSDTHTVVISDDSADRGMYYRLQFPRFKCFLK